MLAADRCTRWSSRSPSETDPAVTRRSDTSLAALLLTQRLVDAGAEPLRAAEYWPLLARVDDPGALLGRAADELAVQLGDPELAARVAARFDAATAFAFELERLAQTGIRLVASIDEDYPARLVERLGAAAPPLLHVVGPINLLDGPALGVVGSRDVSPEGAEVAKSAARAAVRHGWGVASGGARGVDRLAMNAALDAGGTCVGLLADSLLRVTREPEVRVAIGGERLCLATPFAPGTGFSAGNAMARNKLIYALAQLTLVVASDGEQGGTWAGATEALRRGFGAVAVWTRDGGGPGNPALVERGARPIDALDQLWDPQPEPAPRPPPSTETKQLHLGV